MKEQPQDAGQQDQAEQGLAQHAHDAKLWHILRRIASKQVLDELSLKYLCQACGIDVRDVT